jgi:hypothetical protein
LRHISHRIAGQFEAASSSRDGASETCSAKRSNSTAGRSPPINRPFNSQEGVP